MPKRNRTLFDPYPPIWKVRDIIEKLGGVGPVTEKLMAKGFFPPPPNTVQGWSTRNSVSGPWSPALFAIAMDEGLIENPMDALIKDYRLKPKGAPRKPVATRTRSREL
jgi:hypothetical protein